MALKLLLLLPAVAAAAALAAAAILKRRKQRGTRLQLTPGRRATSFRMLSRKFQCGSIVENVACIQGRFNLAAAFPLEKSGIDVVPANGEPLSGLVDQEGWTIAEAFSNLLQMKQPIEVRGNPAGGLQGGLSLVEVRYALRFHRRLGAEPSLITSDEAAFMIQRGENSVVGFNEVRVVDGRVQWCSEDLVITACGFANTSMGGVLICGVNERTREVIGIDPSRSGTVMHHITQALQSYASPKIKHAISCVQVLDSHGAMKWVVVVDIPPALELTEAGELHAVYQRHGDQTVMMQGAQVEDFKEGWRAVGSLLGVTGDVTPVPYATLADCLDRTKLEMLDLHGLGADGTLASARADALRSLRLATVHDGSVVLTVAGMLLLSKVDDWQTSYGCPSFGIQIQVFDNEDPPGAYLNKYTSGPYNSVELEGTAIHMMDRALAHISILTTGAYMKCMVKDEQGRSVVRGTEHDQYPPRAIQELVINAIVHRTYQENTGKIIIKIRRTSLELVVPGAFLPGITAQNVGLQGTGSIPRNSTLARFLQVSRRLGKGAGRIFEGHGMGVARARQDIEAAGGKLEYRSEPSGAVTVMVRAAPDPRTTPNTTDGGAK